MNRRQRNILKRDKYLKTTKKRNTPELKAWQRRVFARDSFKCQICGTSSNLTAHHIEGFSKNPSKRYNLDNGITLCQKCHKDAHKK